MRAYKKAQRNTKEKNVPLWSTWYSTATGRALLCDGDW
jgi:hypothetical protein